MAMNHPEHPEHQVVNEKYILCRREVDGSNEVIKAGPKASSAIGLVDFKGFINEHNLHPLEVAQFLKITCTDVKLLMDHDSWIEPHAKDNLLSLIQMIPVAYRQKLCRFLMNQDGNAGSKNIPKREVDVVKDIKLK